jgi:hypothetical protein
MALSKITADSITSNVITSALIADGQITFADIANNSITGDKLASGVTLTNPILTGSALSFDGTNLGVGTASPTTKIQASIANGTVYTTSSIGNILTVQNTTANGYAGIQFLSEPSVGNAGQAAINSFAPATGDSILAFSTRQSAVLSEKFRIGESGQLGIGGATYGTAGQVLTSAGSGAAPTWANTSSSGGSDGSGGNLYLAVNFGGF